VAVIFFEEIFSLVGNEATKYATCFSWCDLAPFIFQFLVDFKDEIWTKNSLFEIRRQTPLAADFQLFNSDYFIQLCAII